MKKIFLSALLFLCLGAVVRCYAFDWKQVHEDADKKGLADAWYKREKGFSNLQDAYLTGLIFINAHKDEEAQKVFQDMLKKEPKSIEAKWGLAETLRRQNKLDESLRLLEAIIQASPQFSPAYLSLAYIKYVKLDFRDCVELARKVIDQGAAAVDPTNYTRAYLLFAGGQGMLANSGGVLAKVLEGSQVLPSLKKAEQLQPDSPEVLFGLGSYYLMAPGIAGGNIDKAKTCLEKALSIDPFFADAYVRLAQVYKAKGDNKKFQENLNRALEIEPQNALAKDANSKNYKFIFISDKR